MDELEVARYETRCKILQLLAETQRTSAPIELSIGWVKDGTVQEGIVIKSAPPVVTRKLVEAGYHLGIMAQGVLIYKIPLYTQ